MLAEGMRLPEVALFEKGASGVARVQLGDRLKGRRVVLFAVPGAFTPTCDSAHLPSFVRNAAALRAKGVDEIICLSVNDAHVMRYWGEISGANAAGITMLGDPGAEFTRAVGMEFSNENTGLLNRSRRYALVAEDGVVTVLNLEKPGVCEVSTGEAILEALSEPARV